MYLLWRVKNKTKSLFGGRGLDHAYVFGKFPGDAHDTDMDSGAAVSWCDNVLTIKGFGLNYWSDLTRYCQSQSSRTLPTHLTERSGYNGNYSDSPSADWTLGSRRLRNRS